MKKNLLIMALMLGTVMVYGQGWANDPIPGDRDECGLTYQQGYDIGCAIGSSETRYGENSHIYTATRNDYNHCSLYVAGVREGYLACQYQEVIYVGTSGLDQDCLYGNCPPTDNGSNEQ